MKTQKLEIWFKNGEYHIYLITTYRDIEDSEYGDAVTQTYECYAGTTIETAMVKYEELSKPMNLDTIYGVKVL